MKILFSLVVLTTSVLLWFQPAPIQTNVDPHASVDASVPIGVNLGVWTSWGAEQLMRNVLKNPGFEGIEDGALVTVGAVSTNGFSDSIAWLVRPEGFWDGAAYSVRTGALAGRDGRIRRSTVQASGAVFETDETLPGLMVGDVIALRRVDDRSVPTQWWLDAQGGRITPDTTERRPDSPGRRSLHLVSTSQPVAALSYLDAIGNRAGRLLPLRGEWTLAVWARAQEEGTPMKVTLRRDGTSLFLAETVAVSRRWQRYEWKISPDDNYSTGVLELRFEVSGAGSSVWLDDAELGANGSDVFRSEVTETLRSMHPGYIRDWQGQLGDSWQNRVAGPWSRRATRYRPGNADATDFDYGLPEVLTLAASIGARPWIVLPTTMSDAEWRLAGTYLSTALRKYNFDELLIEFGNENWNDIFRPAGIQNTNALVDAATRAFSLLQSTSGHDQRIKFVIGSNMFNLKQATELATLSRGLFQIGIAPYWAQHPTLATGSAAPNPAALFADYFASYKSLEGYATTSIYEMNAHSLYGDIPDEATNSLVTGLASGTALAWQALSAMNAGVTRQSAYTLAGYDAYGAKPGSLIRLFGLTRDLATAQRFRPTGQALALLNRAIRGAAHPLQGLPGDIVGTGFESGGRWQFALASRSASSTALTISGPSTGQPTLGITFEADSPLSNNENIASVREQVIPIRIDGSNIHFELPPYGLVVLIQDSQK